MCVLWGRPMDKIKHTQDRTTTTLLSALRRCRLRERKGVQTDTQTRGRKLCRGGNNSNLKTHKFLIDFFIFWFFDFLLNWIVYGVGRKCDFGWPIPPPPNYFLHVKIISLTNHTTNFFFFIFKNSLKTSSFSSYLKNCCWWF